MELKEMKEVRVVGEVPVIDGLRTSYHQFRDQFMQPNLPVLISGLMDQWRAFKEWASPAGAPDLDYVASNFGTSNVQVADCSVREFTDQKRLSMTVKDYINYWKAHILDKKDLDRDCLLYLKDWHFVQDYPEYSPYSTPNVFMDDWLNLYLQHYQLHAQSHMETAGSLSDYRFVYMGPKGTWTPLHADVFRSYSWSGNICGKKLWHLLPPSETPLIFDRHMRYSVYDIYGDISVEVFPNFHKAGWLECTQERGQILFVPSGWFHQVTNLEDTISINHNWINGCNLHWVWQLIMADYQETKISIEDIRPISDNFEELCQRNLAANTGMNFYDLFIFLRRMTAFFLSTLQQRSPSFNTKNEGTVFASLETNSLCTALSKQILFNLQTIKHVAQHLALVDFGEDCFWTTSDEGELEGTRWTCWTADGQHSQYRTFLSMLTSPCTFPTKSEMCVCANQIDLEDPQSFENMHETRLQAKSLDSYSDVVKSSDIDDIKKKIKTPKVLVQVIGSIMNHVMKSLYQNASPI